MSNYEAYKAQQEAAAAAWMQAHESELSDVDCPEESVAGKKGFECQEMEGDLQRAESLYDLVKEVEKLRGEYWEESTQEATLVEQGGIFNVAGVLACWQGKAVKDEDDGRTWVPNGGFVPERFPEHVARTTGVIAGYSSDVGPVMHQTHLRRGSRGKFGLDECYHKNGKVRAKLVDVEQVIEQKVITIDNLLDDLAF